MDWRAGGRGLWNPGAHTLKRSNESRYDTFPIHACNNRRIASMGSMLFAMVIGILIRGSDALSVVDAGAASLSKLLPFENKDAFFSAPPNFYGVFDGVTQCPQSRPFAQTLAKTACAELLATGVRGSWSEQAREALEQASVTAGEFSGASTACMLRVDLDQEEPQLCCFNLGDSACMVLRPSEDQPGSFIVAYTSEAKMHSNGAPYQLGGRNWQSDAPQAGESFTFGVAAGDVVLCYSDGLDNNLAPPDIVQIASQCRAQPVQVMAKTLAEAARQRRQVDDDVTVVALRLGEGGWSGSEAMATVLTDEAPWEKFGLRFT